MCQFKIYLHFDNILNKNNMKNIILSFVILISIAACSQKKNTVNKSVVITQKVIKKKGTQLVLKSIANDSRCPEGVNCIWAGEIEIIVSVYKDNNFVKDENILLSPKLDKENLAWFAEYFPSKKITEIGVLPYPKNGVVTYPKDYFVKIYF